jgi:hypothetical protein
MSKRHKRWVWEFRPKEGVGWNQEDKIRVRSTSRRRAWLRVGVPHFDDGDLEDDDVIVTRLPSDTPYDFRV